MPRENQIIFIYKSILSKISYAFIKFLCINLIYLCLYFTMIKYYGHKAEYCIV